MGSLILVYLSLRKLITHRTIISGIRCLRRLCSSLSCDTWLNTPDILRLRSVTTCYGPGLPHIAYTCSVIICITVSADLPGLAPICVSSRRLFVSASYDILLAITRSSSFPIILRSAISRYDFRSV